jgi:hypothetical protein
MGKGNKTANKLARKKQLQVGNKIGRTVGRPTKYSDDAVKKLMDVFKMGGSVEEAVSYAGISKETYYNWAEKRPQLLTEAEQARIYPIVVARNIVVDNMVRNRDVNTAKWYLEKTVFKYNQLTAEGGGVPASVNIVFPDLVRQRYEAEDVIEGTIAEETDEPGVSRGADEGLPVQE